MIGALCLATDLGMGLPFEHGLQTTLIASRLAQRLGVDHETERRVYFGSLLAHAGCSTYAHVSADIFGSPLVENLHPVIFGSQREIFGGILFAFLTRIIDDLSEPCSRSEPCSERQRGALLA